MAIRSGRFFGFACREAEKRSEPRVDGLLLLALRGGCGAGSHTRAVFRTQGEHRYLEHELVPDEVVEDDRLAFERKGVGLGVRELTLGAAPRLELRSGHIEHAKVRVDCQARGLEASRAWHGEL